MALCQGQGGSPSRTTEEFRQSWKAAQYAAEHGLMLRNVVTPYVIQYDLSSHRGVDRTFPVGEKPELYIFDFPNGDLVHTKYQMCCRHELHILLDDKFFKKEQDIVCGDAIPRIIQGVVPEGIRVEVPLRRVLSPSESDEENTVVVFLVVYCGERIPLCRGFADECRAKVEQAVDNHMKLRENRAGRIVSRLFPYPTWQPEELLWFSKHQESVTHWCKITSINESK